MKNPLKVIRGKTHFFLAFSLTSAMFGVGDLVPGTPPCWWHLGDPVLLLMVPPTPAAEAAREQPGGLSFVQQKVCSKVTSEYIHNCPVNKL